MKRRDLLKYLTGLPLGISAVASAGSEMHLPVSAEPKRKPFRLLYLHPGELTFLLGRPCNGKTSVALSIALDYVEAGKQVWYFSMARRSRDVASVLGLQLRHMGTFDGPEDCTARTRQFFSYFNGKHVPLHFFDHYFATNVSLHQVRYALRNLSVTQPDLVIYDADSIDCTQLTDMEEATMAVDLRMRRAECERAKAPILLTLGMPGAENTVDARPRISDLKPRRDPRPGQALVDELYFVHTPSNYEELKKDSPRFIELTRANRLRTESFSRLLVKDWGTGRVHKLAAPEIDYLLEEHENA